jgi:REP element-mobilizing transposase RayT
MKPGTFTQLYVHLVLAVKYRERLLTTEIRNELKSIVDVLLLYKLFF